MTKTWPRSPEANSRSIAEMDTDTSRCQISRLLPTAVGLGGWEGFSEVVERFYFLRSCAGQVEAEGAAWYALRTGSQSRSIWMKVEGTWQAALEGRQGWSRVDCACPGMEGGGEPSQGGRVKRVPMKTWGAPRVAEGWASLSPAAPPQGSCVQVCFGALLCPSSVLASPRSGLQMYILEWEFGPVVKSPLGTPPHTS